MNENINVNDIIEDLSELLKVSKKRLNGIVGRNIYLYNMNMYTDDWKARFRKARPIRVAMAVVNALLERDECKGEINQVKIHATYWYKQIFGGTLYEAKTAIESYFNRMLNYGMLQRDGNVVKLVSNEYEKYDEKLVNLLADGLTVSKNNTYFKAMCVTSFCTALTSEYQWKKPPNEICELALDKLSEINLVKSNRKVTDIVNSHIYPLHIDEGVQFYANNNEDKLGIPSIHPIIEYDFINIPNPFIQSKADEKNITKALDELQRFPIISMKYVAEKYGMRIRKAIDSMAYDKRLTDTFPFTPVPPMDISTQSILISRANIEIVHKATNYELTYDNLKLQDELIWSVAPIIFQEAKNREDFNVVNDTIDELLSGPLKESYIEDPIKRSVCIGLYERGRIVEFNEDGYFYARRRDQLGKLNAILTKWKLAPGFKVEVE